MDLKQFDWTAESTFGSRYFADAHPDLLQEAKDRGFHPKKGGGHTPYNDLFSGIFYGRYRDKYLLFKKGIDMEFIKAAFEYYHRLRSSYLPKHEDKEAICAMILSEICEPGLVEKSETDEVLT